MDILVIPTYERADYLTMTLQSVMRAIDKNVSVVLVDDGSRVPEIASVCASFAKEALRNRGAEVAFFTGQHVGVAGNMLRGIEHALTLPSVVPHLSEKQRIITLDSDFIVRPDFFTKIRALMDTQGGDHTIITGFNAIAHPIIEQHFGFAVKRSIGGGNQAYNLKFYYQYVKPALVNSMWDWTVCNQLKKNGGRMLCITPSVCQHIGTKSLLGHAMPDKAVDYVMT